MHTGDKIEVITVKHGFRKLCQQGDPTHIDILEDVSTEQAYLNLDKIAHRWNSHDDLLTALDKIRKEEEYRRKLCNTSDLRSQPLPKGIIESIATKAIADAEKQS